MEDEIWGKLKSPTPDSGGTMKTWIQGEQGHRKIREKLRI